MDRGRGNARRTLGIFRRINEQATIEVARFSPQDFTKQVPEPLPQKRSSNSSKTTSRTTPRRTRRTRASTCRARSISNTCKRMKRSIESTVTEAEITQRYEKDPQSYARDKEDFEKEEKERKGRTAKDKTRRRCRQSGR